MASPRPTRDRLQALKTEYDQLKSGREALLVLVDETEIPESVYNSNAIENSTLSLKETEKILLEMELSRDVSLREVFETKNLARVMEYVRNKSKDEEISKETVLLLHQMLIGNIDDNVAGRFRGPGEYVRVGTHIAPGPEMVEQLIESLLIEYSSDHQAYFVDKIARFHLDFETIHPFNDGNGRIGRTIINYQFRRLGYPRIIIRFKDKAQYSLAFVEYRESKKTKQMEKMIALALAESLHKRLTYLKGGKIVTLSEYAMAGNRPAPAVFNAARRQTIPAFREKGVWKIGE